MDLSKHVFGPKDGDIIQMEGDLAGHVRLMADPANSGETNIATMIQTLNPGSFIPTHFHKNAEQILYILTGACEVVLDGEVVNSTAGTLIHIPKNMKHKISNTGVTDLSFLEITTPTGFEQAFRDIAKGIDVAKACEDNDINMAE